MNARTTALSALIAMRRQDAWADGALKDYTARDRLDRRDAALAARLLYGVVQNRMLLDFYLAQAVASPLTKLQPVVLDILRLGAYQILFLDKIPVSAAVNEAVEQTKTYANKRAAGLVNGSLRTLARRKDELEKPHDLATKYSHPQPLVDCLRASMDEETLEAFLAADNDIPKTALQANPLKASAEQVAAALDEAGIACEPHPWLPGCFLVSGTGNLESLPLFQSGAVYVQDAAAKLAVLASGAAPGMRVLDCCAAPGGKSFAAAMQMENTGSILSCDLHAHKISLIEKNAARLGISILKAEQRSASEFDPALEAQFDLVIADVPCSGLGVIRKKPDIRYKHAGRHRAPAGGAACHSGNRQPLCKARRRTPLQHLYRPEQRKTRLSPCRFCRHTRNFHWNRSQSRTDLTFPTRAMPRSCRTNTRRTAFSSVS